MSLICPVGVPGTVETIKHVLYFYQESCFPTAVMSACMVAFLVIVVNIICNVCVSVTKIKSGHFVINSIFLIFVIMVTLDTIGANQEPSSVACYSCDIVESKAVCGKQPDAPAFVPVQRKKNLIDFYFRYDLKLRYKKMSSDPYSFVSDFTHTFVNSNLTIIRAEDLLIGDVYCSCYKNTASLRGFNGSRPTIMIPEFIFAFITLIYLSGAVVFSITIYPKYKAE